MFCIHILMTIRGSTLEIISAFVIHHIYRSGHYIPHHYLYVQTNKNRSANAMSVDIPLNHFHLQFDHGEFLNSRLNTNDKLQ